MKLHIDALGWLHVVWGVFGVLAGLSLAILALGLRAALVDLGRTDAAGYAAIWLLGVCAGVLVAGGLAMAIIGRALARRRTVARLVALAAAVPNLVVVPFGTALGVYTYWVLLNDDARREFGRPPRAAVA